jgi:hypothetical protein
MVAYAGSSFYLDFSHNFRLHDVAWLHPAYLLTTRGDAGTTSQRILAHQQSLQ